MLLWSGIEALFGVDAELSRRVALYAALMLDGEPDAKWAYYQEMKRAYDLRSRIVHGNSVQIDKIKEAYDFALLALSRLLMKCVEMGVVPAQRDFDKLAVSGQISKEHCL